MMQIYIHNNRFVLLPEKALYRPDEELLIIADLHLGKAKHFRREGIPMPAASQHSDFDRLAQLLLKTRPRNVYFLGDLFHSALNGDWHPFCHLVRAFPAVRFTLVRGNHDIIEEQLFSEIGVAVTNEIEDGNILYTHDIAPGPRGGKLNIVGHLHPGIVLSGAGRQSVKLPCFYHHDGVFVLPAFGVLTGLYSMARREDASIWLVLPGEVCAL